ncbi:MAG: glutathionylspermidine synthase family protein [Pseudomonadota bacterium]
MDRIPVTPREDWRATALEHGFTFHSPENDPYWNESAYYRFTLAQIENDLEDPAETLEQMCFEIVDAALRSEEMMTKLAIPRAHWDLVADSWAKQHRNLYGRMDFAYNGEGPAKLYEYNADTPTSLYETAIFQWIWLEQAGERNLIPTGGDQFNSLHEKLIAAFANFGITGKLHLACASGSEEDWGTIEYLEDCAQQAGVSTKKLEMEEIGLANTGQFTDLDDEPIATLFKLYPWEWLLREDFADNIAGSRCQMIEPAWKSILSNKGLMALLWDRFPGHPNLLASYFADDPRARDMEGSYVRKPIYSREGWNVEIVDQGQPADPIAHEKAMTGPYGEEGSIVQAFHPLPDFTGRRPMCGVWMVASEPAGMCIREDGNLITTDDAHFIPHVIAD